jgi:SAM-dependent methyltransferase
VEKKAHWEQVYGTRMPEKTGWYKPRLDTSLDWIASLGFDRTEPVIDVGGGASTLVDDLVDEGYESITVLDISEAALDASKRRLGSQSQLIMWLPVDVTAYPLPENRFVLWHDRAVFHFLTEAEEREAYCRNLRRALKPGAYAVIGTFAPDAPPKCSGLPVQRYDAAALSATLGDDFTLLREQQEMHVTPGGVEQLYQYCLFQRSEAG